MCASCESCTSCPLDCCPRGCEDSDGGRNTIEQGKVKGTLNGNAVVFEDVCKTTTYVMEYYCGGSKKDVPSNELFACSKISPEYACQKGACIPPRFS